MKRIFGLMNNLHINYKVISYDKILYTLFLISQITCCLAILFAITYYFNEVAVNYEQDSYVIELDECMTYESVKGKLEDLNKETSIENGIIYLDDSRMVFVSHMGAHLLPSKGQAIDIYTKRPEAVIGNIQDRPDIGEAFSYNGINYLIIGHSSYQEGIELNPNSIENNTLIKYLVVYKNFFYKKDIESFASEINKSFPNSNVEQPVPLTILSVFNGNLILLLISSIMLLAMITILTGYKYLSLKRKNSISVLRTMGIRKGYISSILIIENIITVSLVVSIASVLYYLMDYMFINKIMNNIFGRAYNLRLEYYLVVLIIYLTTFILASSYYIIKLQSSQSVREDY